MNRFSARYRASVGTDRFPPPETVPFVLVVLANRVHVIFVDALGFFHLPLRSDCAKGAQDSSAAANSIGPRLVLGLLLFGDGAHLIQVATEYCCVRDVLC